MQEVSLGMPTVYLKKVNNTHPNLEPIERYHSDVGCGSIVELSMKVDNWGFRRLKFAKYLDVAVVIEELLDKLKDGSSVEMLTLTTVMSSNHDLPFVD